MRTGGSGASLATPNDWSYVRCTASESGQSSLGVTLPTNDHSARFTGKLNITAAGDYQFATDSDDASVMWLDRNNDGDFDDFGKADQALARFHIRRHSAPIEPLESWQSNAALQYARPAESFGFRALPTGVAQLWADGAITLVDRAGTTAQVYEVLTADEEAEDEHAAAVDTP